MLSEKEEIVPIDTTMLKNSFLTEESKQKSFLPLKLSAEKSVTVESPQEDKLTTSVGKYNSYAKNIHPTKSLKTLEVVLTSRGKDLKPFWNSHVEENSKNLWLPTKTDCADLDLTLLNSLLKNVRN